MAWMGDGTGKYSCSKCGQMSTNNWADCGQCALIASQQELVDIQRRAVERQTSGYSGGNNGGYSGGDSPCRYVNSGPDWGPAMVMGPLAILFGVLAMGNMLWAWPCVFCVCGFIACFS